MDPLLQYPPSDLNPLPCHSTQALILIPLSWNHLINFLRNLPPVTSIPSFEVNTGMENYDDEDLPLTPMSAHGGDTGLGTDVSVPPAIIHTVTSFRQMQATGRILPKRTRLTAESEADLDRFCAVSNAVSRIH